MNADMWEGTEFTKGKGKYKTDDQFISTFRGLYLTMNFLGTWQRRNSHCWYSSIWYIHSFCLVFTIFGPIAGLIAQRHDTKKMIRSLGLVPIMFCVCMKWVTFAAQRDRIEQLFYFMEQDWTNLEESDSISESVPKSKHVMEIYSRYAKFFFNASLISIIFSLVNYELDSFAARNSRDNNTDIYTLLPVPDSWYPVDYNRTSNIQFLVVAQTMTFIVSVLASISIDSAFVAVTLHLCGQFKILRYFIENITYDSSTSESCKAKIRLMVQRHQLLLSVCDILQDSYGYIILEQLVTCTLCICFQGYTIVAEMEVTDTNMTVVMYTGFLSGATLLSIFAFCFVGDLLTTQSIAIAMAAYNAEWYNCPRTMSRSFLLVMVRTGRPIEITAAKCIPMSLETFTAIIKASASYFSVLRTMGVGEG